MTEADDQFRQQQHEARVFAMGQFTAYLMRRLGAPEEDVQGWMRAFNAGDMVNMCRYQNEMVEKLKPPPRRP